jgi:hypothetical protein
MSTPEKSVPDVGAVVALVDELSRPAFVLRFAWRLIGRQKGAALRATNASRDIERIVRDYVREHPEA